MSVALAAVLLLAGACGQPSIAVDTDKGSTSCADLIVFGLRGSGQDPNRNHGIGQETDRSITNMSERLRESSDLTIGLEPVLYDATRATSLGHYDAGVKDGVRLLGERYSAALKSCPTSRFAFVGFSQGAQVVHEYAYDLTGSKADHLVLIGMIADPRRNRADAITKWSYAERPTTGHGKLGAGPEFGPDVREAAISLCVRGDEVCNAPRTGASATVSETHKHYYESQETAAKTGRQLVAKLTSSGFG